MHKKILYLSPYFWPEEIGSAPYCTDLAEWLADQGYAVNTVAFRPHYPSPEAFHAWSDGSRDSDQHKSIKIDRVAVRGRESGGFKDRVKNDLTYLFHVMKRTLSGKFKGTQVVVAYVPSVLTLYAAFAVRITTRAKTICIVHDIESGLARSLDITRSDLVLRLIRFVERVGLNRCHEVVVLTEGMKKELEDIGCKRPINVVPIWASVAEGSEVQAGQAPTIMYSGNFGKKQNLDQLLPLLKRISDENPGYRLVLRGGGSEKKRIQDAVLALGMRNVEFLPLTPAHEFMASLQEANIHLVPQALNVANYALPSKLFSIMSAGRPFICIAEPESPLDVLAKSSNAGICVYPGDAGALYDAVTALARDTARQSSMGENGRRFIVENMDRLKIMNVYRSIIEGPSVH